VISEELLADRPPATYTVAQRQTGRGLRCPFPLCEGVLKDGWNLRRHFRDVHPMDLLVVPSEGRFGCCHKCGMQVNPSYPRHYWSKECSIGAERKQQREAAVTSALALWQQFSVHGDVLELVEVFKYLGRMLAQDDDDIQAIRTQIRKARATWAHVGQVLRSENTSPCSKVLYGRGASRATLWQRDVGPLSNCARKAGGVPHSSCLLDGEATQTMQGTGEPMDIPKIRGRVERVRVAHHRGIHRYPSADNRSVRGDPPDPRQMQTGCEEAWGNTATLVVGTKDELGRSGWYSIRTSDGSCFWNQHQCAGLPRAYVGGGVWWVQDDGLLGDP
jgi:hypothetical protein